MTPEIQHTPLKGTLTIKQVVTYTIAIGTGIVAVVSLYFSIVGRIDNAQNVSEENNKILHEIRADRKEEARMNNLRLSDIENRQRSDQIRLTVLETKLK